MQLYQSALLILHQRFLVKARSLKLFKGQGSNHNTQHQNSMLQSEGARNSSIECLQISPLDNRSSSFAVKNQ
jgi:hypothetical protein